MFHDLPELPQPLLEPHRPPGRPEEHAGATHQLSSSFCSAGARACHPVSFLCLSLHLRGRHAFRGAVFEVDALDVSLQLVLCAVHPAQTYL